MNLSAKKILGTGLALGLAALNLCAQSAAQLGNLPLWFEAGTPAKFTAHASGSEFSISPAGAEFALTKKTGETAGCRLRFVGANPAARIAGGQKLAGTVNYLLGSDAVQWRANVPTFAQVRVDDVYPGVNVVYYGNRQKLEYDFNLAAGADPSAIALRFDGAEKISVDAQGGLVISLGSGEVAQHPPVAYQTVHGARQEIAAGYKILDAHTAAFALGDYDHSQPLVIDPVLTYSSYFGGNYGDTGWAIAVNTNDGSIYVAGQTFSTKNTNNPIQNPTQTFSTPGAFQTNYAGGTQAGDAFVARFDNSGTNLIYATYLGGNADDAAYAIAVDPAGNAFVAGATDSTDFPTNNTIPNGGKIHGKLDSQLHIYPTDAFVAELNANGSKLLYSTDLGANSSEAAYGIAVDSDDNAFITGFTYSTNFPVTTNAFQSQLMCSNTVYINANAFVAEISAGGTNLNYSTFLGGTNYDVGRAIAYKNGRLFVAGYTLSTNFPVTNWIPEKTLYQTNYYTNNVHVLTNSIATNIFAGNLLNGVSTNLNNNYNFAADAFVTAFTVHSPTNLTPLYSTLLGGTHYDQANAIAADDAGTAYVAGYTTSTNFPDTVPGTAFSFVNTNMFEGYAVATNGFLTKIAWNGTNAGIACSAMFGGLGVDVANGVALDAAGNVFVVGSASSTNFPATATNLIGSLAATNAGYSDVFVISFAANFSSLLYSAYLGGSGNDYGYGIAVDPAGNACIAGQTLSVNFPTVNARQTALNGVSDMFVARILLQSSPSLTASLSGTNVLVSWPPTGQATTNFLGLQTITNLLNTNWVFTPQSPVLTSGTYQYFFPPTNPAQFFRLHKR